MKQNIETWFKKANLSLEVMKNPFIIRDDRIFQLNIERNKKGEYFRIFQGSSDNLVAVIDISKKYQQILLRVREPRRRFIETRFNRRIQKMEEIERFTVPFVRTYLMGMDECHLFIAEIPHIGAINKIKDAHNVLKPEIVKERERNYKILRQGEWFFIPLNKKDEKELTELLQNIPIRKNMRLGNGRGNPHIVQFRIGKFIKGKVKHSDHSTVILRDWYRFEKNTESTMQPRSSTNVIRRFNWID